MAFNNGDRARQSEVIELIPPMDEDGHYVIEDGNAFGPDEPVWTYSDGGNFYSNHLGSNQRLPNGNTLISESIVGHMLEVNSDGEIVWEHTVNRAQIARSLRYAADYPGLYRLHPIDEGVVVINEMLIVNDTTQADEDGEFDSWIELYNNQDVELSLWGFRIGIDENFETSWALPDTSIGGNDYLIIWADDDKEQNGLHTNIELPSRGGNLYFSAPDGNILDFTEFGDQTADVSYGRLPNGSGEFTLLIPTFCEENLDSVEVAVKEEPNQSTDFSLLQSYPNPFNSTTTITYQLAKMGQVTLNVYDINGQLTSTLINAVQSIGNHQIVWNADSVPSGVYLLSLTNEQSSQIRKIILLR